MIETPNPKTIIEEEEYDPFKEVLLIFITGTV
jgi:hypothetical protein